MPDTEVLAALERLYSQAGLRTTDPECPCATCTDYRMVRASLERSAPAPEPDTEVSQEQRHSGMAMGGWMVIRKRETDPVEVWTGDEDQMRDIFAKASIQWSDCFLVRVEAPERARPLRGAAPAAPTEALEAFERAVNVEHHYEGFEDYTADCETVRAALSVGVAPQPTLEDVRAAFIEGALWRGSQRAISGDSLMKEANQRYPVAYRPPEPEKP